MKEVKLRAYAKLCIASVLISISLALESVESKNPLLHTGRCDIQVTTLSHPQVSLGTYSSPSPKGKMNTWVSWAPDQDQTQLHRFVARCGYHYTTEVEMKEVLICKCSSHPVSHLSRPKAVGS